MENIFPKIIFNEPNGALTFVVLKQNLEEQLVDLSSLLYDHQLQDAHLNSSDILQSTMFTQQ